MEMFYSLLILLVGWICFVFAATNIIYGALRHANEWGLWNNHEEERMCWWQTYNWPTEKSSIVLKQKENRGWKIFKMLLNALALTAWYYIAFFLFPALTLVL